MRLNVDVKFESVNNDDHRCSSNGILWWLSARIGRELEFDLPLLHGVLKHVGSRVVLKDTYSRWRSWLQSWWSCAFLLRSCRCSGLHLAELSWVRWLWEHSVCWHLDIIIDLRFEGALLHLVFFLLSLLLFDGFSLCLHIGTFLASIEPLSDLCCVRRRSPPLIPTATKTVGNFRSIYVYVRID